MLLSSSPSNDARAILAPTRSGLAVALFAAVFLLCPQSTPPTRAQGPGTVDPVFGGGSLGLTAGVSVVAVQPDGKVLVGGRFKRGVARLNANGEPDASFGGIAENAVNALVLQPDE